LSGHIFFGLKDHRAQGSASLRTQLRQDFFTISVWLALTAFVQATFTNEFNRSARRALISCLSPVRNAH